MIPICGTCVSKEHCAVAKCSHYEKRLKLTNADRIRNMTDEELAKFIYYKLFLSPWCDMSCGYVEETPCVECTLEWLKQEDET